LIESGISQDFRRQNEDTFRTRDDFKPLAGDAGIEFYMATEDPQGNPTNGITRTQTSETGFSVGGFGGGMDDMKSSTTGGADGWPSTDYLNIWVCNMDGGFLGQVLGFAYPPAGAPNWPAGSSASSPEFDGVALHYQAYGLNNPYASIDMGGLIVDFDKGRSATHEVGHYLGIRHIWGDGFFGGCTQDDGIEDTPNQESQSQFNCNHNLNSCTDSPIDYPDMVENFMDYSDENCQNMFTAGQIAIMRSMLATARAGLPDIITDQPPVSISDPTLKMEVELFPNPVRGLLTIKAAWFENNNVAVQILDLSGRVVKSTFIGGTRTSIDLSHLEAGAYLLVSNDEKFAFREQFIKR